MSWAGAELKVLAQQCAAAVHKRTQHCCYVTRVMDTADANILDWRHQHLAAVCACLSCAGVSQRELLQERAQLLYGQARFTPLKDVAVELAAAETAAAAAPAGAASA